MRTPIRGLMVVGVGALCIAAISAQSVAQSGPEKIKVAVLEDGVVVPALTEQELRALFASHFDVAGDGDGPELDSVSFLGESYVVAKGHDAEGNCTTVARALTLEDDVLLLAEENHTCSGVGCWACAFTRDGDGKITGCECLEGLINGYCNHTVSTGG